MNRTEALREHLRSLPVERVADALGTLDGGPSGLKPDTLCHRLSVLSYRPGVFGELTLPQCQLLRVAAEIAVPEPGEGTYDPALTKALQAIGYGENLIVDWQRVLEMMHVRGGEGRRVAEEMIAGLAAQVLTWPTGRGEHHLATGVVEAYGTGHQRPPLVSEALNTCYNVTEVRRVALALGVDPTRRRDEVQGDVVTVLTDPARLRSLFDAAPPGAMRLMTALVAEGGLLGTYCFVGGPPYESRFRFRKEGSGDSDTDWLAEHGLIFPHPHVRDRAMVPMEVYDCLKERTPRPFTPKPPEFAGVPVNEDLVRNEGRAALLAFLGAVDRLVDEVGRAPLSLRKSGGVTARDQKRVAGTLGESRERTRLWIELAHHAGALLLAEQNLTVAEPDDAWFDAGPVERLSALLRAWMELPVVATWSPEDQEPIVPGQEQVPAVVPFRSGTLLALSDLPEGWGTGIKAQAVLEEWGRDEAPGPEGLWWLFEAAAWHRDAAVLNTARARPFAHTLREAELVGVVAHGALTPVGRALSGGDPALVEALNTLLPEVQEIARFQGDMTATVMGTPATRLERLLSTVADREGDGYASVWRLSATSVGRALNQGYTGDELLEELSMVSVDGALPQTLEYLVKDVARAHGRIRVTAAACCVRCEDTALAREMMADRALRDLHPRLIADTVLISRKSPEETVALLRKAGYMPVREDENGDTIIERGRSTGEAGKESAPLPYVARRESLESCARRLTDRP